MLRGALAAALTPLRDDGAALDDDAFGPYCDFLVAGGLDGLLAFGTNGEGVLFSVEERMRGLRLFIDASRKRLQVAAHCGAQTTADTVELAADAAEAGADAIAVIGPPYFPLDTTAQLAHFSAAADACAPLPFYVYEFARTSGYAVSLDTLARLRDEAPNFVGMKVSDAPWDAFQPYLLDGLAVFVGPEALIHLGIQAGAVGAVSALAGAFPAEVAAVVRDPTEAGAATLAELRAGVERFPRQAALKRVVASRGVPLRSDVRAPLRDLTESEAAELDSWLGSTTAAPA
jgi:dihydrodipicolinate synthase/N-acetylneuraminate lyase